MLLREKESNAMSLRPAIILSLVLLGAHPIAIAQSDKDHAGLAGSLYIQCQIGKDNDVASTESKLAIQTVFKGSMLDQLVDAPKGLPQIRVKEFIPCATLKEEIRILDEKTAGAAIQIEIVGKKQKFSRWLVAADRSRDRLSSLIGNWRLLDCTTEKAFIELEREFIKSRCGKLHIKSNENEKATHLAVSLRQSKTIKDLGLEVSVLDFLPHFDFDKQHKPTSKSFRSLNPAVLLRLKHEGIEENRWVFARSFDISLQEQHRVPFKIELDCAIDDEKAVPSYLLVRRANGTIAVLSTEWPVGDRRPLTQDSSIKIPRCNYSFKMVRSEPHAQIHTQWEAAPKGRNTVLRIETTDVNSTRSVTHWLQLGRPLRLKTSKGIMSVSFSQKK